MTRDAVWLRRLAEIYFNEQEPLNIALDDDDLSYPDEDRRGSVLQQVFNLAVREPEDCWRFVEAAIELPLSQDQLSLLGAGVFENLMNAHGWNLLDRVEQAAKRSPAMQAVVDSAWTMSMDPYVARAFKTIQTHRRKRSR